MLIPFPLKTELIEPTLAEWAVLEPQCAEPHRWLGGSVGEQHHLWRALTLDHTDQIARRRLIISILSGVSYAAHELPIGYLGTPRADLAALEDAEELLPGLNSERDRTAFQNEIADVRAAIVDYLERESR